MSTRRPLITYAAVNLAAFVAGVYGMRIREMSLYLYIMVIGFPASLAVVPASEAIVPRFGWSLGTMPHVWTANLAAVAVNCALIAAFVRLSRAYHQR